MQPLQIIKLMGSDESMHMRPTKDNNTRRIDSHAYAYASLHASMHIYVYAFSQQSKMAAHDCVTVIMAI